MNTKKSHILVIDDNLQICQSLEYLLGTRDYQVSYATTVEEGLAQDQKLNPNLIIMDMNYTGDTTSGQDGLNLLTRLLQVNPLRPVIVMTAWANTSLIVETMKLGAGDFVEKPWQNQRLLQVIAQQLKLKNLEEKRKGMTQHLSVLNESELVWQSPAMKTLMDQIKIVSETDASILLLGENGTGKSSLAKMIYHLSQRKEQNFISVNMGAIPENLFESEMFGHKKGAFTDAKADRIGRFSLADEGTLFLDEVANMSATQQSKLLRVLETGEFEIIGSSQTRTTDIRLIAASNGDLKQLISQERFREDLYYRLNTIELTIPSLKDRVEDIPLLAEHFLKKHSSKYNKNQLKLSEQASQSLLNYLWPGNVRELSHVMERAVLLSTDNVISAAALNLGEKRSPNKSQQLTTLAESEQGLIQMALSTSQGNIPEASELLGISASALYRRLDKYDIKYG
ncbi:MAG: sigma-54 dependent transcriptional regulator [Psychrosphaera sp.]|nr:sigma-54 dependent transcriptional regulator [Psychrosphaera sp.]